MDGDEVLVENYLIIWLVDAKEKHFDALRSIVNTVRQFTDLDACIQYIEEIKYEKIFLIISPSFTVQMASLKARFSQVHSIHVFCDDGQSKGKETVTQMESLCKVLKNEVRLLNQDLVPVSTNSNELEPSFMYFQLLKENLLKIESHHPSDIRQLVEYCRVAYADNAVELPVIDDLGCNYRKHTPIWWYTLESFIYRMLNHALRTFQIETLIKMKFFIQDLHEQIKQCHSQLPKIQKSFVVYRGQGLPNAEVENLRKKPPRSLLSFNAFFSTSRDDEVSKGFARRNRGDGKQGVLFEIKIDPSSSYIYTPLNNLSAIEDEEEILFSMASVFRMDGIEEIETGFWKINLSSTNDRDPILQRLTDHMRLSLGGGDGWRQMAQLLIKMGEFDRAIDLYQMLLNKVDASNKAESAFLHNQLGYIFKQKEQLQRAFEHYQQALQIHHTYMSDTDSRLSSLYANIGAILKKLGDANGALKYYELVLKIDLAATKPNQLEIAIDHNNIGSVLDDLGRHSDALKSYQEALTIKLALLPSHHASLASTYSNIGLLYRKMGDLSSALSSYQKALEIQQKSLLSNHPSFIALHGKMATVLEELGRYTEALQHAVKALEIAHKAYGPLHPETQKRQNYRDDLQRKL